MTAAFPGFRRSGGRRAAAGGRRLADLHRLAVDAPDPRRARTARRPGLGHRRGRQLPRARLRALLLHAQGRVRADRRRDVAHARGDAEVQDGRGPLRPGAGRSHRVRAARAVPDFRAADRAAGRRRAATRLPADEGAAGERGPVRPGAEAAAPAVPARRRAGHLADRRGDPRHAARHPPALPVRARPRLPGARPGRRGGRRDRRRNRARQPPRGGRGDDRRPRRRQHRGPVAVQRGSRRARDRALADPRDLRRRATRPISRFRISSPTFGRSRPRTPATWSCRTSRQLAEDLDSLRPAAGPGADRVRGVVARAPGRPGAALRAAPVPSSASASASSSVDELCQRLVRDAQRAMEFQGAAA